MDVTRVQLVCVLRRRGREEVCGGLGWREPSRRAISGVMYCDLRRRVGAMPRRETKVMLAVW
eukprot:44501-Eustigmatos_ZCMA.PRE.1